MKKTPVDLVKIKQDEYISYYRYTDIETREELGDGTTLIFIEMNKFQKNLQECNEKKERWLCSIKHMNSQLRIPDGKVGTELEALYSKGEIAALPKTKKLNYISYIMSRNDELNSRAEQISDARAEGRAEGIALSIKRMFMAGFKAAEIADVLGVGLDEIDRATEGIESL